MLHATVTAGGTSWWAGLLKLATPTTPTEFWAFVVAVIASIGLISVVLLKKDMHNRMTREAVQCAVDRCNEMCLELLPLYVEIFEYLRDKKIPLFVTATEQVSFDTHEEAKKLNDALAWIRKLEPQMVVKTLTFINRLECWSVAFSHNPAIADQKVAFEPCSTVFCQMVMAMYPCLLTQRRASPVSGPYQNTVTLFKGWYAKKAKGEMLEKLNRMKEDAATLPNPVGT